MLLFVICWPCFELYFDISAIYLLMFEARGGPLANRHPPIILLPLLCLQLNHPSVCLSAALFVHHMLSISFHPFDFSFLPKSPLIIVKVTFTHLNLISTQLPIQKVNSCLYSLSGVNFSRWYKGKI